MGRFPQASPQWTDQWTNWEGGLGMSEKGVFRLSAESMLATVGLSIVVAVSMTMPVDAAVPSQPMVQVTMSSGQLLSVSCTSPTSCTAVGTAVGRTLVESWNGSAWSVVPSPNVGSIDSSLDSVSCTSTANCVAAGVSYTTTSVYQILLESWNGTAWSVTSAPLPSGTDSSFTSVSCTSTTNCMAVGYHHDPSDQILNLIESWNGSAWSIDSSPATSGNTSFLRSVSCTSTTDCKAVGQTQECPPMLGCLASQILIESWNGSAWSIMSVPNENATDSLFSVSCTSSTQCVATGGYYDMSTGVLKTVVESWDGTTWAAVYGPSPGPVGSGLVSVSCSGSNNCVTVGQSQAVSPPPGEQTLVANWDGTTLSLASSPNPSSTFDELDGVACPTSTKCVAVGYLRSPSVAQTLIESWDGTTWSVIPSPNVGVAITTTSLPGGTVGSAYSATLVATGGNPPYTWKLVSGSKLPKGLKLNKATGGISGTPKLAGTTTFTVEVRDTKTTTKPHTRGVATATLSIAVS